MCRFILFLSSLLLFSQLVHSQVVDTSLSSSTIINLNEIENNNKRDEIQRYTGYEDLLFRYFTLPYDLSTNTNEQGRHVDFGFALIALLPLVLLAMVYKRRKLFYALAFVFILYLSLCLSYSFFHVPGLGVVRNHAEFFEEFIDKGIGTARQKVMKHVFLITYPLAKPIRNLGESISGESDHITYPILISLFIMSVFFISKLEPLKSKGGLLFIIFWSFAFLWLLLSGGIIWYGFLLLPIGYLILGYFRSGNHLKKNFGFYFIRELCLVGLIIAAIIGYVGRVSNIGGLNGVGSKDLGKKIVESNIFQYSTGMIGERQALNNSYSNIGNALDIINSDQALIYQVGTFFAFDIKQNTERLYNDQTLGGFYRLIQEIRDKDKIIEALKMQGFKYILIDLYTNSLDRTPEKSLTKKYQLFLNSIYQNSSLQLMATDRVIEDQLVNGSTIRKSEVFGKKIITFGSYAIYKIL